LSKVALITSRNWHCISQLQISF